MRVYYNEVDAKCCAWLKELMAAGLISKGEIDNRDIQDVLPSDLAGFDRAHFFAGVGVWDYALNQAGYTGRCWTGSCPCQSFSAAGEGKGFADERHLWPDWFHLVSQCRPRTIFGEQVEAAIRHGWLDLVQSDLEGIGYACGAVPFPACGIGAPHIRQRLYFVADAMLAGRTERRAIAGDRQTAGRGGADIVADAESLGRAGGAHDDNGRRGQLASGFAGEAGWMAEPNGAGWQPRRRDDPALGHGHSVAAAGSDDRSQQPGPTNGFWRAADWLQCTDGKWRPVSPGTFPLAHGAAFRVGRLRGYGNAIVAPQAIAFIEEYMRAAG